MMGDSGEGLIDAESRIQERMDELARERSRTGVRQARDPEGTRAFESLRLARIELGRQFTATAHEVRRVRITEAIEEIDRRLAGAQSPSASSV